MLTALLSTAAPYDSGVSVQAGRPVRSTLALVTLGEDALAGGLNVALGAHSAHGG
jgi:hypothetical protein